MTWISALRTPGHLAQAISHYNEACDDLEKGVSKVEVSRLIFYGLNKVQTEWIRNTEEQGLGDVKAFQTMISKELSSNTRMELLISKELKKFISLKPMIMNHNTLRHRDYNPDIKISDTLRKEAEEEHRKLTKAFEDFNRDRTEEIEKRVIKRAAELLYIVRSNNAHGEKTPYGPDLIKKERDEKVCEEVIPLQILLFNFLLDRPEMKLVSYGTLRPGQRSHQIISDLKGNWTSCKLRGFINEVDGLSEFSWNPSGPEVVAQLLVSSELKERWSYIDQFEGHRYKRRLVPVFIENGITFANIYSKAL